MNDRRSPSAVVPKNIAKLVANINIRNPRIERCVKNITPAIKTKPDAKAIRCRRRSKKTIGDVANGIVANAYPTIGIVQANIGRALLIKLVSTLVAKAYQASISADSAIKGASP